MQNTHETAEPCGCSPAVPVVDGITIFPAVPRGTGPQGHGTRGKCAKRSQFAPHRWNEAAVAKAANVAAGHKLRNKPNSQGVEPKRGRWNPPLYAGRTLGRRTCQFSLYFSA